MIKSILSLLLLISLVKAELIRDDIKEIVLDTRTNLMWQDNSAVRYDVSISKNNRKTWPQAISYCENLNFASFTDWKLPNINELFYMASRETHNPALSEVFKNVSNTYYWSSTTYAQDSENAWRVDFSTGENGKSSKVYTSNYVRCVRSVSN